MKSSTSSLFAAEMQDQLAAAEAAVAEAERRGDPLLMQATMSHLDALRALARRNGLQVDDGGTDDADTAVAGDAAAVAPA